MKNSQFFLLLVPLWLIAGSRPVAIILGVIGLAFAIIEDKESKE